MVFQTAVQLATVKSHQGLALENVLEIVEASQFEILLFVAAAFAHYVLFGERRSGAKNSAKKPKLSHFRHTTHAPALAGSRSPSNQQTPAAIALSKHAQMLMREGANVAVIAQSLGEAVDGKAPDETAKLLAGMVEHVGRAVTPELLAGVRAAVQAKGLELRVQLGEALLRGYLITGLHDEFADVLAQMEAAHALQPSTLLLALKAALAQVDLDGALTLLGRLGEACRRTTVGAAAAPPQGLVQQLSALALRKHAARSLVEAFSKSGLLSSQVLEVMLAECVRQEDQTSLGEVEELGRAKSVAFTVNAYSSLVRGASSTQAALDFLDQASKLDFSSTELALAAADVAASRKDAALADVALQLLSSKQTVPLEVAAAFLRLGADGLLATGDSPAGGSSCAPADAMVLALYENKFRDVDLASDAATVRLVMDAVLRSGRSDLLRKIISTFDVARTVTVLKGLGTASRLHDVLSVFEACGERPACVFNSVLDACVQCRDLKTAAKVMEEASSVGVADVITYNTIIKAHLQDHNVKGARAALARMRSAGITPSCVTFNELLDASLSGAESPWHIVEEMTNSGLKPNSVTCSILLKSVDSTSKPAHFEKTLAIINTMGEEMDEVLLSSVCEACVRCRRSDLLVQQLKRQRGPKRVTIRGAHTYGSVIRAFGFVKDIEGVWQTWNEMRSRNILPTSITLGCMIEALVSNISPEAGHQMLEEALGDESLKPIVNVVMYCSVLKGFSHQKRFDRMWVIYQEMLKHKMQLSIVTFNTLVDACSRCGEIGYIPEILQGMHEQNVQPNIVTYGAIIKGYCQENQLNQAFQLLEDMKSSSTIRPDEITYNTILDGCARYSLWEKGMEILKEMQDAKVNPSNFTLSVLVKLANRSRRLESAFDLSQELAKKYRIQMNMHVYNNLIHACIGHAQHARAVSVFVQALQDKALPDARTYTLLLRGCISAGKTQDAVGLLRAATGLPGPLPAIEGPAAKQAQLRGGLPQELISEVLEGIATQLGEEHLAVKLFQELKRAPHVQLDNRLGMRLTAGRVVRP